MKLTRHNGRSGRNGTYNPKHNDRRFDVKNSEHIDEEKAKQNVYWDCYQGIHFPESRDDEENIVLSFERVEEIFYKKQYADYCDAQHERNRKTGHSERDRSPDDLRLDKKTCPEESLIQIGTMEESVKPEVLAEIATEFFSEFDRRFGERIHILNWSLHLDESTPHIHERHVFDCENRYGEIAPQQEKALEALGFERPYPDKKPGKFNNRKVTFDAACRTILFDIALEHGLHLDQEPAYGGRAYLEKQDYILMKQKEKIAAQEEQIESKEEALKTLTVRIEDTEAFVDDVADTAYEQAVKVVTKTVQEKVRNEDFEIIAEQRKAILSSPRYGDGAKKFAANIFTELMSRFKGMTQHISERMSAMFQSPEMKEEIKEPIRESIRERLARSKLLADAANERRWQTKGQSKKTQQHMER